MKDQNKYPPFDEWVWRSFNRPYKTRDIDEFIEKISYKETRNYVKKVLKNYGRYLRLYRKYLPPTTPLLAEGQITYQYLMADK